jgi:hypothetical protein
MMVKHVFGFSAHAVQVRADRRALAVLNARRGTQIIVGRWHRNPASDRIELCWHADGARRAPTAAMEPPSPYRVASAKGGRGSRRRRGARHIAALYGACV